jgi:REP element-mobilizing transposase RayT
MPAIVSEALRSSASSSAVKILVWCLMPNHLHVLVDPWEGNVIDWVRVFKGRVASEARQEGLHSLWQKSFHDHVLRAEEDTTRVVKYLLENPVRASMAEGWEDWPHHGSLTLDLSRLSESRWRGNCEAINPRRREARKGGGDQPRRYTSTFRGGSSVGQDSSPRSSNTG